MWQVAGREASPFKPKSVWEPFKEYEIGTMVQTAKAKGDSLETAIYILESAILKLSPSYSDKTFRIQGKKIISVAGVHHELDVWVGVELGYGYDAVFIFECKNWQEKVAKNDVMVFSEKIKVAQTQKGFFVAKAFTRDAEAQAKTDPYSTPASV